MRDILPPEASRRRKLARRLLDHFALYGYELVTPPAFELADVLERGLGTLDPRDVLRFVEPESGEVAALRPDVTPQIARIAATRLADRPVPMRLCYEGTVLRRRKERARKHRQIPQAGVELLGVAGPDGDLELMSLAVGSARAAGLSDFVLDMGHADVARALMNGVPAPLASSILDALAHKDSAVLGDLVTDAKLTPPLATAFRELPKLHGDGSIWKDAERILQPTPAASAFTALRDLWERAHATGLEVTMRVDLGEVRGFAYYTGALFHLLAEGPGEPFGSGGRYDDLLSRFDTPMPAAGFGLDLDNLAWSLTLAGSEEACDRRVLLAKGPGAAPLARALRALGVPCVIADSSDAEAYARAWTFSHLFRERPGEKGELWTLATGQTEPLGPQPVAAMAAAIAEALRR
jgi:ATP phosphoribosyltransferase regulatory subunit